MTIVYRWPEFEIIDSEFVDESKTLLFLFESIYPKVYGVLWKDPYADRVVICSPNASAFILPRIQLADELLAHLPQTKGIVNCRDCLQVLK